MTHPSAKDKPKAVLVGLQLPGTNDAEHLSSLEELGRLAHTLGFEVLATLSQKRATPVSSTVVGGGKLSELARLTGGSGKIESLAPSSQRKIRDSEDEVDEPLGHYEDDPEASEGEENVLSHKLKDAERCSIVVFDHELTPNQLRNLESATGAEVLDRTGVILEIFHRHAKTREARLQVEIARLKYMAPRLRQTRGGADRQGGGLGAKGAGETSHELDKRRIRDRIAELTKEINEIHTGRDQMRKRRGENPSIALVGYTNAGKSSLMRVLTGSDVLVEDKLFATLDTTIRALQPETQPRILVSDTVGFIKKLPHDLVASFRSTLDEAADASLLLFVVDAADPVFRSQLDVTREVLGEIGVKTAGASLLILNKIDCLDEAECAALSTEFPDALQISTRSPADIARVHQAIVGFFEKEMTQIDLLVPYAQSSALGEIRRHLRVLTESYCEIGVTLRVRGYPQVVERMVTLCRAASTNL